MTAHKITSDRDDLIESVRAIYEDQHVNMVRFAAARLGDFEAGRDAVNDTFVRALRRITTVRDAGTLDGWIWTILINETRRSHRVRRRRPHLQEGAPPDVGVSDRPDIGHDVRRLIRTLPERQRTILFLKYYADLSNAQIAATLDIAPGTVGAALHQAHATLRPHLDKEADSRD